MNMFVIITLIISLCASSFAIRIGSFNLHQYGKAKAANASTTKFIAGLLNTFDIAIIQEISDVDQQAPFRLLDTLNTISAPNTYDMSLSSRLGNSNTKEQYAYLNRESTSKVQLVSAYVYEDKNKYFERPPYVATFKVKQPHKSAIDYFTVMNVHLRPDDALKETIHLRKAIDDFIRKHPQYFNNGAIANIVEQNVIDATETNKPSLKTNHPIILVGDFNADCSYISLKRQQELRNIHFVDFTWIINNEIKTNVRQSCTYDRILINGDNFIKAIVPNSNSTVRYDLLHDLTLNQALAISDHFPIKFDINW